MFFVCSQMIIFHVIAVATFVSSYIDGRKQYNKQHPAMPLMHLFSQVDKRLFMHKVRFICKYFVVK